MKTVLGLMLTIFSASVLCAINEKDALKFVPGGTLVKEKTVEVKVETTTGTVIEIEFNQDGKLVEAVGSSVDNDILVPGDYLMTLKDAVQAANKVGKKPVGEWSLKHSVTKGWRYEFVGIEEGKNMEYAIDAKSGNLVDSHVDE